MKSKRVPVLVRSLVELRSLLVVIKKEFVHEKIDVEKVVANISMGTYDDGHICIFVNEVEETFSWVETIFLHKSDELQSISLDEYISRKEILTK